MGVRKGTDSDGFLKFEIKVLKFWSNFNRAGMIKLLLPIKNIHTYATIFTKNMWCSPTADNQHRNPTPK